MNRTMTRVVNRNDLIGLYIGQTSIKTQQVCDDTKGGVLIIEESQSILENDNTFDKECAETLKRNENNLTIIYR